MYFWRALVILAVVLFSLGCVSQSQEETTVKQPQFENQMRWGGEYFIEFFVDGVNTRNVTLNEFSALPIVNEQDRAGPLLVDALKSLGFENVSVRVEGFNPWTGEKPAVTLNWSEVSERNNKIMLHITPRSTAKLMALNYSRLDDMTEWVHHVQKVEVNTTKT